MVQTIIMAQGLNFAEIFYYRKYRRKFVYTFKKWVLLSPDYMGKKDILIVYDKIAEIARRNPAGQVGEVEVIDCRQCLVCPGIIDQHVHITGGGGEQGPGKPHPGNHVQ